MGGLLEKRLAALLRAKQWSGVNYRIWRNLLIVITFSNMKARA